MKARRGDYLAGLPVAQAAELAKVNAPGLTALAAYLASGQAVAFLGAGVSAPLYPLWNALIADLVAETSDRLTDSQARTCRALASSSPESVVEILRQVIGLAAYREVLRRVLRVRTAPDSGRSWTPLHELVCRCAFKAVVTTNYDPGIVDARMRVRPGASATGFMTWEDELGLDRWRTGDVFGDEELPVLFAHGQHNRPDSVVLATTEYRRAYAGKLPEVLTRLMDGHLCWLGFSFADQRIASILREIADRTGTRLSPGGEPRHVAVMAWDPAGEANDPEILTQRAQIEYGAQLVLYPAPRGDHSALDQLLETLTDPRFPAARPVPVVNPPDVDAPPVTEVWVPAAEPVKYFTGREEELARLDRWAADPEVALIGVTAWGGAGKTALVTHWVQTRRPAVRGIFAWSFYGDPSAEHWAGELLGWARHQLGIDVVGSGRIAAAVLTLLREVPLLLVLDGLEVAQEGPAGDGFGRLLDGVLREVLAGACQQPHCGLVVLTSRFPFADLEGFDGGSARMLDVPPFSPAEGSALIAAAGAAWLPDHERRELVEAVDGHALATGVLASLLAAQLPASDLAALRADLAAATRTDARVGRVLGFYADRLSEVDRYLLAAVCLFARPVQASAVLAVGQHQAFGQRLAGWTPSEVEAAVRVRLGGLASWHPDGTTSAHPLVRETFRPLALDAAEIAAETSLAGMPTGAVTNRADALRLVEAIELLLDAGQWSAADDMYNARSNNGLAWMTLPAARLGQRAATAFVANAGRRADCSSQLGSRWLGFYMNDAGVCAMASGDLATARDYLTLGCQLGRVAHDDRSLAIRVCNLAECLGLTGHLNSAQAAAAEAISLAEIDDRNQASISHAFLAWLSGLAGDVVAAEGHFAAADRIEATDTPARRHLSSLRGIQWADWLLNTGRHQACRELTRRNAEISRDHGWNDDLARCDRALGRVAMVSGDAVAAGTYLESAAATFRDGEFLTELASTLTDLAEQARMTGQLDAADTRATEAITIAAPRGLVLAHSAALSARARIRASQFTATGSQDLLYQGRDAADAALRLAIRHQLLWHELDGIRAHAALDQAEGVDRGWTAKSDALHARLVPEGLDPDPLATVERLVAKEERHRKRK